MEAESEVQAAAAPGLFDVEGLARLLDLGGPVVVILGLLSVAALAIALTKLLQFRRTRVWSEGAAAEAVALYLTGRGSEAATRLLAEDTPLARTVATAIRGMAVGDRVSAREATEVAAMAEVSSLRGGIKALEFIAGVAPLLGLFGTVLGMITAFQALEAAGDQVDPAILAGGIWEALFTTAAGLAVAIPALALATWLGAALDRLTERMELLAGKVLTAERSASIQAAAE